MDVRVGLWRRLNAKELMLLNYGAGEHSWESFWLQGDQTSQSQWKSTLKIHWKDWCWSSNTSATWCEEQSHQKRPSCWERLSAGGEVGNRGWEVWMVSLTQWTRVRTNSKTVKDREGWCAAAHGVTKGHAWLSDWTTIQYLWMCLICL